MNATNNPQVKELKTDKFRMVLDARRNQIILQMTGKRVKIYQYDHAPTWNDWAQILEEAELRATLQSMWTGIDANMKRMEIAICFESKDNFLFN